MKPVSVKKPVAVNPLKKSQVMGATLAILGLDGVMPLHHGSQGCTAFTKNFLTQHFREVIPMQTTALTDIATIMGDDRNLFEGLSTVMTKHLPKGVAVISTGVSEVRGDDLPAGLTRFQMAHPEYAAHWIFSVSAPDFAGDAESGFAAAVESVIMSLPPKSGVRDDTLVLLIPSFSCTPGDVYEIKKIITQLGYSIVCLPDISETLSGAVDEYVTIPRGGPNREELIAGMGAGTIVTIGRSMKHAGEMVSTMYGGKHLHCDSLTGIENVDRFVRRLMRGKSTVQPDMLKRERALCVDALLDSHFYTAAKSVAVCMESDGLYSISRFLTDEMGVSVKTAVSPVQTELLQQISAECAIAGDFEDAVRTGKGCDLMIGNTNGIHAAELLGVPLYRIGYPVKDRLGHHLLTTVGYAGTMRLIYDITNLFAEQMEEEDAL